MKCPSPPGAVPAANAAAAGAIRLPPARPPARAGAGAGAGPAPARPLPLRARPGSGRGAAARLFVRRAEERRDAGQAASCSPPPSSGPEAEEGASGHRPAPSRRRPGRLHFVRGAGRGHWPGPRSRPCALGRAAARSPRGRPPPARRLARGGMAGPGRFVCPGAPGAAGGRQALGAGPGPGRASRGMRARGGRPAPAGLTVGRAGRWGRGQPAHLRGEEARSPGGRSGFGFPAVWLTRKECSHLAACGPWTCPEGGKEAFRIGLRLKLGEG
ncbi:nuclear transcription factor Y subunit beta isoform X1 [Leopardus geoffroyi]|uniref:nuclear transcription factor Y subunit beta isoform X1 n=1 Tax=Leopardus geoffroyi TaxID=46844 RepID=UPI001E26447E|nr:nuclear transcription factor Y subunit beta isoform X1 [Leopardus geoffroyi]